MIWYSRLTNKHAADILVYEYENIRLAIGASVSFTCRRHKLRGVRRIVVFRQLVVAWLRHTASRPLIEEFAAGILRWNSRDSEAGWQQHLAS